MAFHFITSDNLSCFFPTRHDGEARLNEEISELRKELAERSETITKLQKTVSTFENEVE